MSLKCIIGIHKLKYIGFGRDGSFDYANDMCYNVYICEDCHKIIKRKHGEVTDPKEKNIPIVGTLIKDYYARKGLNNGK